MKLLVVAVAVFLQTANCQSPTEPTSSPSLNNVADASAAAPSGDQSASGSFNLPISISFSPVPLFGNNNKNQNQNQNNARNSGKPQQQAYQGGQPGGPTGPFGGPHPGPPPQPPQQQQHHQSLFAQSSNKNFQAFRAFGPPYPGGAGPIGNSAVPPPNQNQQGLFSNFNNNNNHHHPSVAPAPQQSTVPNKPQGSSVKDPFSDPSFDDPSKPFHVTYGSSGGAGFMRMLFSTMGIHLPKMPNFGFRGSQRAKLNGVKPGSDGGKAVKGPNGTPLPPVASTAQPSYPSNSGFFAGLAGPASFGPSGFAQAQNQHLQYAQPPAASFGGVDSSATYLGATMGNDGIPHTFYNMPVQYINEPPSYVTHNYPVVTGPGAPGGPQGHPQNPQQPQLSYQSQQQVVGPSPYAYAGSPPPSAPAAYLASPIPGGSSAPQQSPSGPGSISIKYATANGGLESAPLASYASEPQLKVYEGSPSGVVTTSADDGQLKPYTIIEKPVIHYVEKPVVRFVEKTVIKTVEKPVIKYIEKPVYKYIEKPYQGFVGKEGEPYVEEGEVTKDVDGMSIQSSISLDPVLLAAGEEASANSELSDFVQATDGSYVRKSQVEKSSNIPAENRADTVVSMPKELPAFSPGPHYQVVKTHIYGPVVSGDGITGLSNDGQSATVSI